MKLGTPKINGIPLSKEEMKTFRKWYNLFDASIKLDCEYLDILYATQDISTFAWNCAFRTFMKLRGK